MKTRLLEFLRCPLCKKELSRKIFLKKQEEIVDGVLNCLHCGHSYPVIRGIPRIFVSTKLTSSLQTKYIDYFRTYKSLLPKELLELRVGNVSKIDNMKGKTKRCFGYEWSQFSEYLVNNFERLIKAPEPDFYINKLVLDAGCGAGRHMLYVNSLGSEIIGVDISESVDVAYQKCTGKEKIHIIQADLYSLPFRGGCFDFIYSIGVLHHLPDPKFGFNKLIELLKPDGLIAICVYSKSLRKVLLEFVRWITTKLPPKVLSYIAFFATIIDYGIFCNTYKFLSKISIMKPIIEYITPHRIKEYAMYSFYESNTDWYDRLSAPISNFYTSQDIEKWFIDAGLHQIKITKINDSWQCGLGTKL